MKQLNRKLWGGMLRAAALCLTAALLLSLLAPIPAGAADRAQKEEVVYVRLLNDGSVDEVYVVNSFVLNGDRQIVDYGNYSHVRNLSNMDTLRLKDGVVTIDTQDDRLYYEGYLIGAQLPWEFSIVYRLDGKETAPEDLGGKSGRFEMEISERFNPLGNREFFDRYCLQVAVSLESDVCKNISADGGTIAAAGGSKQINFVVIPGRETVLKLTADVSDFKMPAITIAGVTMNMNLDFDDVDMSDIRELIDGLTDLDDGVKELLDGILDMYDGVADLYDGVKEYADGMDEFNDGVADLADGTEELRDGVEDLRDGVAEMADGAEDLVEGVDELADGFQEFDDGVAELKDGADELYDGAKDLYEGTEKLYDGFGEIVDGADELEEGVSAYAYGAAAAAAGGGALFGGFDTYFDVLLSIANAQLAAAGLPSPPLPLTRANYQAVLADGNLVIGPALDAARAQFELLVWAGTREQIFAGILAAAGIAPEYYELLDDLTKAGIQAAVEAQMADPLVTASVNSAVSALMAEHRDEIIAAALSDPEAAQLADLYMMLYGYESLLNGLGEYAAGVSKLGSGASSLAVGMTDFNDGLKKYQDGLGEYLDGVEEFRDGMGEFAEGAEELRDGSLELLDGVIELRDGVVEFRDGVVELHDGVIDLYDGIVELNDGVIELRDGSIELRDGAIELRDGVGDLLDGTRDLYNGVDELKDGTGEIRENTETLDTDIVDGIKDTVDDMMGGDGPVKSFVSAQNGEVGAVQFLMQTEGIARPEPVKSTVPEKVKTTFWQRLLALFGF